MTRLTVLWIVIAVLFGSVVGFGVHNPIASTLNLNAAAPPDNSGILYIRPTAGTFWEMFTQPPWATNHGCAYPKFWTGNGCADTNGWTSGDQLSYMQCVGSIKPQPASSAAKAVCAQQTEQGKGRK